MKTNNKFRSFISLLLIITLAFIGCTEDSVDPCDQTIASPKDLFMTVRVQVLDENNNIIPGEQVALNFELHACNGNKIILASYMEDTDSTGIMGPYTQKMTLQNTEDEAFITATAANLQSSVKYANKTYKYNDFDDDDNETYLLTIQVQ